MQSGAIDVTLFHGKFYLYFGPAPALITLERHRVAYADALAALERALDPDQGELELVAEDLRLAARALERIAGRIDVEDVLGEIFKRLCVGK